MGGAIRRDAALVMHRATASAPGGIGNLGPGLDVLGCAVTGPRDEVTVEWSDRAGVIVRTAGHPDLPTDPTRHTAALAAAGVLRMAMEHGIALPAAGLLLDTRKGLPLFGGQGGSSASAVAGAVATNALLGAPFDRMALLESCLAAEEVVSGRAVDNVGPVLLGGLLLIRSMDPIEVVRLPVPAALHFVIAHPAQRLATVAARDVLPSSVSRAVVRHQSAQVGAMVAACFADDLALFGRAIDDRLAEPARRALLPGFDEAKRAALMAGALGVSISGAGPSAFAVVRDLVAAEVVARAMIDGYATRGIACTTRVARVDDEGARVERAPSAG